MAALQIDSVGSLRPLLQNISDTLNRKFGEAMQYMEHFVIITNKSHHVLNLKEPIILDPTKNYTVSLVFFTVYNAIKNITSENNSFHFKEGEAEWQTIKISEGSYEIKNLNNEIHKRSGLDENKIYFGAIQYLNRAEIKIGKDSGMKVKFTNDSFGDLLGFNNQIYDRSTIAQNRPNITKISTINIKTNLIDGGYLNEKRNNILHTLPTFTVPIGYKIIESPNYPVKVPLTKRNIDKIEIEIIDEDGKTIDFSGEEITIRLVIEQV